MQKDASALFLAESEYSLKQLCPSRAAKPRNSDDLAPSDRKRDVSDRRVASRQRLYLKCYVLGGVYLWRKALGQLSADHKANDLVDAHIRGRLGGNELSVSHNAHVVGYAKYLLHFVRDIDYPTAS